MRSTILAALLLAGVAALSSAPARAEVSADINIHLGERYPVQFRHAPRVYEVPQSDVYYVPDRGYDMYQCDDRWYINDGGSWYGANSYRGPFLRISYQSVPRRILRMQWGYRHQTRGYWSQDRSWHGDSRGWNHGRGHGNGHGRGDDRDDD